MAATGRGTYDWQAPFMVEKQLTDEERMVNIETINTSERTDDVRALILGRAQTGIAAF